MDASQEQKSTLFKELVRRRIFYILGLYLGALVAALEFTEIAIQRYKIPDYSLDLVLMGMLTMIPALLLFAWGHGAPGRDKWNRSEKIGIPANVLITFTIMVSLIPADKDAKTNQQNTVTIAATDESGSQVFREVPKQELIQRLHILFFDPKDLSADNEWLSYGLPYLLSSFLQQDSFINTGNFYNGYTSDSFWQVQRAGFQDGLNLPTSLVRALARDNNTDFYTQASIGETDAGFKLTMRVFDAKTGKQNTTFEIENSDIFLLLEEAASQIKNSINTSSMQGQTINEIPIRDLATDNIEALKLYINAKNAVLLNNDYEQGAELMKQAIDLDPSFAIAMLNYARLISRQGKMQEAEGYLQQALRYSYKLPEQIRFNAKANSYAYRREIDKAHAVYKMWIELYPNDTSPKNMLANSYLWNGNKIAEAIELFEQSLKVNSTQDGLISRLASLYTVTGELDKAKSYYREYAKRQPTSYTPFVDLGDIERREGNLKEARSNYQRASVIRTDMVTPVLRLAELNLREGKLAEAQVRFDEALTISQAPNQQSAIYMQLMSYYYTLGQPKKAFEYLVALQDSMRQHKDPINVMFETQITLMHLYVQAGQAERAYKELNELKDQIQPPFDKMISFGFLYYHLAQLEAKEAEEHLLIVDKAVQEVKMDHLFYIMEMSRGLLEMVKKDYKKAIGHFEKSVELYYESVSSTNNENTMPLIYSSLVEAKHKSGQLDEALEVAEIFLKQWPMNPNMNLEVAETYFKDGDKEKARLALNKALAMWKDADPEYYDYQRALELEDKLKAP
ncbi:tetratricopeptide repeat protein [Pleionea sp. CnH1-48]|uniref:tetratricopeptide repeat protein n=1 Tax=Pleionea sp. CnH1-48 TaxID=2954494 RepID=UPI002096BA20|nr:tetratricopeptide repeat protein [Pleionea sp. CnH1-48]MCO7225145.1 tetratricopeptide repeat protein [Pleionea sp. CnH1-48]